MPARDALGRGPRGVPCGVRRLFECHAAHDKDCVNDFATANCERNAPESVGTTILTCGNPQWFGKPLKQRRFLPKFIELLVPAGSSSSLGTGGVGPCSMMARRSGRGALEDEAAAWCSVEGESSASWFWPEGQKKSPTLSGLTLTIKRGRRSVTFKLMHCPRTGGMGCVSYMSRSPATTDCLGVDLRRSPAVHRYLPKSRPLISMLPADLDGD
jgi:hypothetical protein